MMAALLAGKKPATPCRYSLALLRSRSDIGGTSLVAVHYVTAVFDNAARWI